jgi:hypothetical protein
MIVDLGGVKAKVQLQRTKIEIPDLSQPQYRHLWRDPKLERMGRIARRYAVEMAYAQYTEQAILAGMFGNAVGAVRTTIAAGATSQVVVNTGALTNGGASGAMDQTPQGTAWVVTGHPGTVNAINTFTAVQAIKLTSSTTNILTMASQTVATAITVGDAIFVFGSNNAGGATTAGQGGPSLGMAQQLYIGLSTQAFGTATQANVLTGEPTDGTGTYHRIGWTSSTPTSLWNNQSNFPLPSAASPSILTTGNGPWSFPASSAAWSSGATNLQTMFICDSQTGTTAGTNVDILAIGSLGTSQAVNAGSITLSFANGAITLTLT